MADRSPFDELVARLDGAMVVVTVAGDGEVDGCLVGFHSQASIDPRRYVVWLSRANRTHRLASDLAATHLGVHALTAADHHVAEHFGGQTGDEVDKLADVAWTPGPGGVPLVDCLPSRFAGRILDRVRVASTDHTAFVLQPEQADLGPDAEPFRLSAASDIEAGHSA